MRVLGAPRPARFREFEADLERRVREAREKERTLADFVLDRTSLRHDLAQNCWSRARQPDGQTWSSSPHAACPYFGGTLKDHYVGGQATSEVRLRHKGGARLPGELVGLRV